MLFSIDGPVTIVAAASGSRRSFSSSQNRSSGQSSIASQTPAAKADLDILMDKALAAKPGAADTGAVEEIDRSLLDYAGADAAQYVFAASPFDDDVGDAPIVQELPEQQAGRARADNRELGAHFHTPLERRAHPGIFSPAVIRWQASRTGNQ